MTYKMAISVIVASMLALTSMSSLAGQGQRQGGNAGADRMQQVDRARSYDRDRMQDRDRIHDAAQDRDRDRIHMQDPSKIKDQDIYGNELMSNAERKQYRKQIGAAKSQQAREQYQAKHEQMMQQRALSQGKDLVPPGQGPMYGGEFMTVQERNQYREQLRLLDSDPEREQFQAQHRDRINQRANALGLEVEEAE